MWWMARKCRSRRRGFVTPDKHEKRLGSYELFQRSGPLQAGVWDKMMRGLLMDFRRS